LTSAKEPIGHQAHIVELSAIDLSRAIHRRDLSCIEVMTAYLAQIERINPRVNALVSMAGAEQLLRQAAQADAQLASGLTCGWMHGFPQAPKDLAPVAGMVTTRGSSIYRDNLTQTDSLTFERMRRAGAIFIGRSNTPEFGLGSHTYNTVFGATRNAFDPSRTAGGSSGGAAVALALRMLPVADGSDMMGSLRNPAAFNNVFGMRPSFGRVPGGPAEDVFFQQLSTAGPMARSVPDLAMLLSVQAGHAAQAPFSNRQDPRMFTRSLEHDLTGVRIGWLGDFGGYLPMEAGLLELCEGALGHFRAIGCLVDEARTAFAMERVWNAWVTLRNFSVSGAQRVHDSNPALRAQLKPAAIWEIEHGNALSGRDVYLASVERTAWYQELNRLFSEFDYLVLPSAQVFPFDADMDWPKAIAGKAMDTYHRWMEVVVPASLSGLPGLNVPAGFSAGGLPMGIQIIGRAQADFELLQMGYAYEQASGTARVRSPLLDR
jgi:amidase